MKKSDIALTQAMKRVSTFLREKMAVCHGLWLVQKVSQMRHLWRRSKFDPGENS